MVLNPLTVSGSLLPKTTQSSQLRDRLTLRLYEDMQAKQAALEGQYQPRLDTINQQSERWARVKVEAKMVSGNIDKNLQTTEKVRDYLLQLRSIVHDIENKDDDTYNLKRFDDTLKKLNEEVGKVPQSMSLIAPRSNTDFSANTLEVKTGLGENVLRFTGIYLGTNFSITEADGDLWIADQTTETLTRQANSNTGSEKLTTSLRTGLRRDSGPDGADSIDFTANYQTDPVAATGTLEKGGLKIMGSWFYDWSDPAVFDQIRTDLDTAMNTTVAASAQLTGYQSSVKTIMLRADAQMEVLRDDTNTVYAEKALATMQLEDQARMEFDAISASLDAMDATRENLALLFPRTASRGVLGAIMDTNA